MTLVRQAAASELAVSSGSEGGEWFNKTDCAGWDKHAYHLCTVRKLWKKGATRKASQQACEKRQSSTLQE